MQQIEGFLEERIGHGAAQEMFEPPSVAQKKVGQEGHQQKRGQPGHEADGERLQMVGKVAGHGFELRGHGIGEMGAGQGRPMRLERAQGMVEQLQATLQVAQGRCLSVRQVAGEPGQ